MYIYIYMYKTKNGEKVTYEIGQTNKTKYTKQQQRHGTGRKKTSHPTPTGTYSSRGLYRHFLGMFHLIFFAAL